MFFPPCSPPRRGGGGARRNQKAGERRRAEALQCWRREAHTGPRASYATQGTIMRGPGRGGADTGNLLVAFARHRLQHSPLPSLWHPGPSPCPWQLSPIWHPLSHHSQPDAHKSRLLPLPSSSWHSKVYCPCIRRLHTAPVTSATEKLHRHCSKVTTT